MKMEVVGTLATTFRKGNFELCSYECSLESSALNLGSLRKESSSTALLISAAE